MSQRVIYIVKGSQLGQDPGVTWIFNDWQGGTMTMGRHMKGCYMDLMVAQFNNGYLDLEEIKTVLASDFGSAWPTLQKKFLKISPDNPAIKVMTVDLTGKEPAYTDFDFHGSDIYIQVRLNFETVKRKKFNNSRRKNLSDDGEHPPHMGNGNGIGNELEKRKGIFISEVSKFTDYPKEMLKDFCDYWTEHEPKGFKMRFEMQPVFEIAKRLATWKKNAREVIGQGSSANANGFPDYFDLKLAKRLSQIQWNEYRIHLRSKGLNPVPGTNEEVWRKA